MTARRLGLWFLAATLLIALAGSLFVGREFIKFRKLVAEHESPPCSLMVKNAFLAAEDPDFEEHGRLYTINALISTFSATRATYETIPHGSLTQQLVKQTTTITSRGISRSVKEVLVSAMADLTLEKTWVVNAYVERVYLGSVDERLLYGASSASRAYFGKTCDRLSAAEAAALAGLIRSPTMYSFSAAPERSLERRNKVLEQMHRSGSISAAVCREASRSPLVSGAN
jgi:membrane peptidoglycan carboxypeptidase